MSRFFIFSLVVLFAQVASAATDFKITGDSADRGLRIVKVELSERITEREIGEIARKIYLNSHPFTSVHFRVQGQANTGVWAVAKFNPEMEIILYEAPQEIRNDLAAHRPKDDGQQIGSWINTRSNGYRITITKSPNGTYKAHLYFVDKSHHTENLTAKNVNEQVRYYVDLADWNNKYYTIGADGRLQYWSDKRGMYESLAPAK